MICFIEIKEIMQSGMGFLPTGAYLIRLTNCVKEISSQAMPIVDVPNISPDVFDE